jgi:hypothetical protein
MSHRARVLVIVGPLLLVLATCVLILFAPGHAVAVDRLGQVVPGMTETQVKSLLGAPDRIRHDRPGSTAFFYGGFLRLKWCTIEVYFGADDRVTGTFHDH